MSDFKVVLPTTKEEWQRDMSIAYNQALDDFAEQFKAHCRKFKTKSISDADIDWVKYELKR